MPRLMALVVASLLVVVHDATTSAQSAVVPELARTSVTSVHAYVAAEAIPRQVAVPPNIATSNKLRQLIETMLRQSPTFRRQCLRIGAEGRLTIDLGIAAAHERSDIRAILRFRRHPDGRLAAVIRISPLSDPVELIAHEVEHVIEQLDGIDLAARAAQRDAGVKMLARTPTVFETVRASRAGQKVASETIR